MKSTIRPNSLLMLSVALSACTTIKRDDHSYTYIYQHHPGPQRQVVETVTTHQTRTRRFAAPDETSLAPVEQEAGRREQASVPDLRSDPIPPVRQPASFGMGGAMDRQEAFYETPARVVVAPYRVPPPVSCYRQPVFYAYGIR